MRTITPTERARMSAAHANYHLRVEIKDSENNWRDLTNLSSINWVDVVSWSADIDTAVMTGTISLKREHHAFSLAPLLTGSALNKRLSDNAYAPLIDLGRAVRISTAITAHNIAPITADWKEVFLGYVTDTDFAGDPATITIGDLGSRLTDTQIETERMYGDAGGTPVESAMQQILDDNMGAGVVTLFVPVSPTWNITPYTQARGGLLEGLRALALQIGWDERYVYDNADVFRFTFYEPDRAKTTPDATIGPSEYLVVPTLAMSIADIRNVAKVNYQDSLTGITDSQTASDAGSIAEFGRRYMEIGEGSSSNIDTAVEALAMATAAISDLSQPAVDQQIEQFYFWPVQLGDLIRYLANGVHYDSDQDWGVVGYTHTLSANQHRTMIRVRGKVAGAYRQWLFTRNGQFSGEIDTGPSPEIFELAAEAQAFNDPLRDGMAWQSVKFDKSTESIELYAMESATTPTPIPELASNRLAYSLRRQEGDKWNLDDVEYIVGIATRENYYRKIVGFGVGGGGKIIGTPGQRGPTIVHEIQAVNTGTGPSAAPTGFAIASDGTTNRITWANGDATASTIIFRNGYGIVLAPGTTAFIDTGLSSGVSYTYSICHFKNGQTSDRVPSSGGGGGGGGGGTVTPPADDAAAPTFDAGYPKSELTNTLEIRWHADPSATEVALEISSFVIVGVWTELIRFTDPSHVPNGTYIDSSKSAGTKLKMRIRSIVAGSLRYSDEINVTWGLPPAIAPKFVDGTPFFDGSSTDFSWTLASTDAISLDILKGVTVIYHTTNPSQIQSGSTNIGDSTMGGKSVRVRANYAGGVSATSTPPSIVNTHTGGL